MIITTILYLCMLESHPYGQVCFILNYVIILDSINVYFLGLLHQDYWDNDFMCIMFNNINISLDHMFSYVYFSLNFGGL